MHATYTTDQTPTLRFERRLNHPVETVWRALTDPGELRHWFPSTVDRPLTHGAPLTFMFEHHDEIEPMQGEVTQFEPPRRLAFSWGPDRLQFELEPTDGGTGCVLRFTVELEGKDKAARDAAGWHVCLDRLALQLDDGSASAPGPEQTGEWRGHYEEYQRRGLPAEAPIPE